MAKDKAFKEAEELIEEARRTGDSILDLSGMNLSEIPDSLENLTNLTTLNLSENQLSELPDSLGNLTKLTALNLFGNQLSELPDSLGNLTKLTALSLFENQLSELPDSLGNLTKLTDLYIFGNQLTAIPDSLGNLTNLTVLNLSGNQLSELPDSLVNLTNLTELHSVNNQLVQLPDSLGNLTKLALLDLDSNQLSKLPNSLGNLTNLTALDLTKNLLPELPDSLGNLTNLKSLFLQKNELLGIPNGILGPGYNDDKKPADPATILEYYFSTRGTQGRPLREIKLIVVGRGGVGKTSLIKRLNGEKLDIGESETHGINISPLQLECEGSPVTARVWDFGGQHVLHAMHEFFLTSRSLYLLVLSEREDMGERDAAYWLQLIRSYAGNAPVVVALNKSEGASRELDRESLEKNYGPILGWIATDCAEEYQNTIDTLKAALNQAAEGMPEVNNLFPAKWWKIKQWLEKMTDPYLEYSTYQKKCKELGEKSPEDQATLAAWLNDLGIAINYADDGRLHDTTVLRPDWLANGIYAILRANDSSHKKQYAPGATVNAKALGPIYRASEDIDMLKANEYPEDKWPFLIELMSLFQLALPIQGDTGNVLIPTLLPIEPPEGCEEPTSDNRTRIRYEFTVVPSPLIPRLLVRMFSLIKDDLRWRRGAILHYGDAQARVWTTQDERWVRVTADGLEDDRDALLTMIRRTLKELFREYKDLKVKEHWEYQEEWVPRKILEGFGVLSSEDSDERKRGREAESTLEDINRPVELFVSYSHNDTEWFKRLRPLLNFDQTLSPSMVKAWHDNELQAGDRWDEEIRAAIERMDVFVCLLSYDFLSSGYIKDVELKRALELVDESGIEIVPIVLYDMNLEKDHLELSKYNPLPGWGKSWRDFESIGGYYQDAHKPIREGLRQAIEKVRQKRKDGAEGS